jgi:hypothetical protein
MYIDAGEDRGASALSVGCTLVTALLVYEAFSYYCLRPSATSVCGLKLIVYETLSY